jgi:hypothetical protein
MNGNHLHPVYSRIRLQRTCGTGGLDVTRPLRIVAGILAAAMAASCGRGPDHQPGVQFSVRDSAGVRIAENGGSAPAIDSITGPPRLAIGLEDGPDAYLLSYVQTAITLADGRIVVANGGTGEIRVYSPTGQHLTTYGRTGEGPGEFRSLSEVGIAPPDTIVALDRSLNRLTVFAPDGSVAATHGIPQVPAEAPAMTHVLGRFADGTLLLKGVLVLGLDPDEGRVRGRATYARWSPGTEGVAILGALPDLEQWVVVDGGGVTGYAVPFAAQPRVAVGARHFHYAAGERFEVERRDTSGTLGLLLRRAHDRQAVTRAQIEARRAEATERMNPAGRARYERALSTWGVPDHHPAIRRLLVAAGGDLWVREETPDDPERSLWSVFDPEGRWKSRVELPRRFIPTDIGIEEVLGISYAPDTDVEQVVAYPLPRNGR